MDFFIAFLWYLLAFVLGAILARVIAAAVVKPQSSAAAFADLERTGTTAGGAA